MTASAMPSAVSAINASRPGTAPEPSKANVVPTCGAWHAAAWITLFFTPEPSLVGATATAASQ